MGLGPKCTVAGKIPRSYETISPGPGAHDVNFKPIVKHEGSVPMLRAPKEAKYRSDAPGVGAYNPKDEKN